MSDPAFQTLSSIERYRGWVIDVHTDEVRMPDGSIARRDVIDHPGAVGVVALDEQDQVVLLRQYRQPLRRHLWELPAGLLDVDGEQPWAAAKRELHEEAALTATTWHVLLDLHTSPGMTNEAIRIYLARGLNAVPSAQRFQAEHEEVTMTVQRIALAEALVMIQRGSLTNGPAVAGVLAARLAQLANFLELRPADSPWTSRAAGLATEGAVGAEPPA